MIKKLKGILPEAIVIGIVALIVALDNNTIAPAAILFVFISWIVLMLVLAELDEQRKEQREKLHRCNQEGGRSVGGRPADKK